MKKHAQKLKAKGCSEEEIAEGIGISYSAFRKHKKQFESDLKIGQEVFTESRLKDIENSLIKKALGYDYIETKKEVTETPQGEIVKFVETTKHVPASDTSIIFSLVNRNPDKWQSINNIKNTVQISPDLLNVKVEYVDKA